eukprot:TRINITY_DN51025_c0_g1_i1.p1 TRINITY_DN51025_c0_g1~~TRINITY_DN51025_c0_g1_i1.p1  ORF type:complete len:355 (-),score=51.85 TRINITY_DN51025_c0_g1_i1:240-1304(-)
MAKRHRLFGKSGPSCACGNGATFHYCMRLKMGAWDGRSLPRTSLGNIWSFLHFREYAKFLFTAPSFYKMESHLPTIAARKQDSARGWEELRNYLEPGEFAHIPDITDLYFCVVSTRRACDRLSVKYLQKTQACFDAAGVKCHWYVAQASAESYRQHGLEVVVGGNLPKSRNLALQHAASSNKACVQISDELSNWTFDGSYNGVPRAFARFTVSPIAMARFILAKMRAEGPDAPRLGGIANYSMGQKPFSKSGKISTDFFVSDSSPVRFDNRLAMYESIDFTQKHLRQHGSVLRCAALTVSKRKHHDGGKLVVRGAFGQAFGPLTRTEYLANEKARKSYEVLRRKWPNSRMSGRG